MLEEFSMAFKFDRLLLCVAFVLCAFCEGKFATLSDNRLAIYSQKRLFSAIIVPVIVLDVRLQNSQKTNDIISECRLLTSRRTILNDQAMVSDTDSTARSIF